MLIISPKTKYILNFYISYISNPEIVSDAMPVLLYKFSEQTLQPGPSVSLKCIAKGNPPPQIIWTRDGFPIPQDARWVNKKKNIFFLQMIFGPDPSRLWSGGANSSSAMIHKVVLQLHKMQSNNFCQLGQWGSKFFVVVLCH